MIIKLYIPDVAKLYREKGEKNSGPFFAFTEGYKMCSVCPNSINNGENTHVSIFLHVMKGPYDDDLQQSGYWPLRGIFTVELLNQLNNENHYIYNFTFNDTTTERYTNRVLDSNKVAVGWGEVYFIPQNAILHNDNNSYLKNNNLYFRIHYNVPERDQKGYSFPAKRHLLLSLFSAGVGLVLIVVVKYVQSHDAANGTLAFVMFGFMTLVGISIMRNCLGGLLWGILTLLAAFGCMGVSERIKKSDKMQIVGFVLGFPLGNIIACIIIADILHMPWDIIVWWLM